MFRARRPDASQYFTPMKTPKLTVLEKIGFGGGDAAVNVVWSALAIIITFFYTDVYRLNVAHIAMLGLLPRLIDAFADVAMGMYTDSHTTRWGRYRPYFLIFAVPFGLAIADQMPSVSDRKRARGAMMFSGAIVGGILLLGAAWWAYEARKNAREVLYQPPPLNVSVEANSRLLLSWNYSRLRDFLNYGGTDHLMPDHGHLMHLAVLRMPRMDAFYHLHPTQTGEHEFSLDLPSVPDGDYELFADIVHGSGFAETLTAKVTLQGVHGTALTGDNAGGPTVPISGATSERTVSRFPDGSSLVWEHEDKALRANKLEVFRFEARGQDGKPLTDLENYMGMAAHAFIVRDDGTVFAHVHPSGSASMAAMEMAEKTLNPSSPDQGSMGMTMMPSAPVGPEISFPYGFPAAGKYRLFVQIKRNGVVETGVFDTVVNN